MKIEIRNDSVKIDGYVNVTGKESRVLPSPRGRFIEKVLPQTFQKALMKADDVEIRFNHMKDRRLGSIKEGNLELYEDAIGLKAIATIHDAEVIEKAKNGEIRSWSFGFIANKDTWEDGNNDVQIRTLEDIDLLEVSLLSVTAAYPATSVEVRNDQEVLTESRYLENKVDTEDLTTENRGNPVDYSLYEKQIELLKMKGGNL